VGGGEARTSKKAKRSSVAWQRHVRGLGGEVSTKKRKNHRVNDKGMQSVPQKKKESKLHIGGDDAKEQLKRTKGVRVGAPASSKAVGENGLKAGERRDERAACHRLTGSRSVLRGKSQTGDARSKKRAGGKGC